MPRLDWRTAVRALAGFAAGVAIWIFLSPPYDRLISTLAERAIRTFERPAVTRLRPAEDQYVTVDRSDFDPRSKRPAVSIRDLTFNIVLLTALFATAKRPFADRNIGGFLVATVILGITHVFGAVTEVMSIYVLKLGLWSQIHYGAFERNAWSVANHFYRLVLMYAIAFALWWMFRGDDAPAASVRRGKGKKR